MATMVDGKRLTYPDLLELLAAFNADAKTYSRRGRGGQTDPRYGDCHACIDDCLRAMGL